MKQLIRKVLYAIILILGLADCFLLGWDHGYEMGYHDAMVDVMIQAETPYNFLKKKFDIRVLPKIQQNKEHRDDKSQGN